MKKYLCTILTLAILISTITMPLNTLAYSESLNESSQETNNDSYQSFLQSYYERYQKYLALHQADNEAIIEDYVLTAGNLKDFENTILNLIKQGTKSFHVTVRL